MANDVLSSIGVQPDPSMDVQSDPSLFIKAMISMLNDIREGKPADPGCLTSPMKNLLGDLNSPDRFEMLIKSNILDTLIELIITGIMVKEGADYILYLLKLVNAPHLTTSLDERASLLLRLCLSMKNTKPSSPNLQEQRSLLSQPYNLTISLLRDLAEKGNYVLHFKYGMDTVSDIPMILGYLAFRLCLNLDWCLHSPSSNENAPPLFNNFKDFKAISRVLCNAIQEQELKPCFVLEHNCVRKEDFPVHVFRHLMDSLERNLMRKEDFLVHVFRHLMDSLERNLETLEHGFIEEGMMQKEKVRPELSLYLAVLEELNFISKLCEGEEELFWAKLKDKKASVRALILQFANRTQDYGHEWLLEHNDVTDSESRMHLALLMIPQVKLEPELELIQELVDWFHYLDTNLFETFTTKKLTDPKILQDWLRRWSEVIFNSRRNPLFLECSDDPTRFCMNYKLKPEPFYYDCMQFAGKLIALALISKVRIGVGLDHGFLWKLREEHDDSSLESFFEEGFARVFGVSMEALMSFRGLEVEDINKQLHGPRRSHQSAENTVDDGMREPDVQLLLHHYQRVRKEGRKIKKWREGMKLGSGSYGEVYQGLADDGFFFAAKKVPLTDAQKVSSIENEIGLLCQCNHGNIVEYYGTQTKGTDLYIFLEFVSGSSLDKVIQDFILDDFQVSSYTKQILQGLKYLHRRKVMHGDIKCANVLLDENGCVKIADFGLANVTGLRSLQKSSGRSSNWYVPESETQKGYGLEADIRSLGLTVLEMLTRECPNTYPPTIADTLSPDSRDFIQTCLQVNQEECPTAARLLQQPFVKRSEKTAALIV